MARLHAPKHHAPWAAMQVGEFAVGSAVAYVAVGAAWAATAAVWAPLLVASVVVAAAVAMEIRFGSKVTGFVVGLLPTAVVTAGALAALTVILARLSS